MPAPASADAASDAPTIGGRYAVVGELGAGAMGEVFHVRDASSGESLALKRMRGLDDNATRQHRSELHFRREFHTLARLTHPRIVRVGEFGFDGRVPFYTMELLDGADLRDAGDLSIPECCSVLRDVAAALGFLHARGLIHRDLKPRNVRYTSDGRAKLMDFGVLATMGVAGEIAGTPPSIPPEAVRGLPLDGRADLFGLGALAYRLLSGRDAFPARTVHELPSKWSRPVAPPSATRKDVPAALDDLVLALLALDPAGRPSSAAEVNNRLTVIGALDVDPELAQSRGWLNSAALVGRDAEMTEIRSAIQGALVGQGRAVLLEAATGAGKTRLLREAGLDGQVAGALVLRARGGASPGPFGVLRQLIEDLFAKSPADGSFRLGPHASIIGRIVPDLVLAEHVQAARAGDPAEDRLRLQAELRRWLSRLAAQRPLVLLIDDLQRADEASVALLAALAHDIDAERVSIVAAQRIDEEVRAPATCAALRESCRVLRLHALGRAGVVALMRSLFGDVAEVERLGSRAHDVAGGNPMLTMMLARTLIDDDVVRYEGGTWILPVELGDDALPRELTTAMDHRVAALSPGARALAETLAVLGARGELGLCARLAEVRDEDALFDALDELVLLEVLVGGDLAFEFRHEGLREALLRALPAERKQMLHLRAASALEEQTDEDPTAYGAIGWHYLRGGERLRGAAMLEQAGRALYDTQAFHDAISALQAALQVYEAEGQAGRRRCLELRQMLMRAGVLSDRRIVIQYAEETLAAFDRAAGMALARRLSPVVGRMAALGFAVVWVGLLWALGGGRRRFGPFEGLTAFVALTAYAGSVYSLGYQTEKLHELLRMLDPLRALHRRIPGSAVLIVENFLHLSRGTYGGVIANADPILDTLARDQTTPLKAIDRSLAYGAIHYMVTSVHAMDHDPKFEVSLAELDKLDLRFFDMAHHTARAFFHRLRGEESLAEHSVQQSEILGVQLGNAWVFDSQLSWIGAIAHSFSHDVSALKRSVEHLERLEASGFRVGVFAKFAAAEQLRVSGGADAAVALAREALREVPADNLLMAQLVHMSLADSLLATGQLAQAREVVEAGLALRVEGDEGLQTLRMRMRATDAVAAARLGLHAEAAEKLDLLRTEAGRCGSPVLVGMMLEATASALRESGAHEEAARMTDEAQLVFRGTQTPALVARAERLSRTRRELHTEPEAAGEVSTDADSEQTVQLQAQGTADVISDLLQPAMPATTRSEGAD